MAAKAITTASQNCPSHLRSRWRWQATRPEGRAGRGDERGGLGRGRGHGDYSERKDGCSDCPDTNSGDGYNKVWPNHGHGCKPRTQEATR